MRHDEYDQNVFINCPFDREYSAIFEAIVFAVINDLLQADLAGVEAFPRAFRSEAGVVYNPDCPDKSFLIFDTEQYRFQKFVSDLSGQDIHQHGDNPKIAVTRVRNWLRTESGKSGIPGGAAIYGRYQAFRSDLPEICFELKLDVSDLTFADFSYTIARWLKSHQTSSEA